MLTNNKIPFINENILMIKALKIMTDKKLGTLIVRNKKKHTTGIITDGQIRRFNSKNVNFDLLKVRNVMTKNPIKIEKNTLVTKALSIMNENKITSLCVYDGKKKSNTIGIIHVHNILENKIYWLNGQKKGFTVIINNLIGFFPATCLVYIFVNI